MKVNLFVERVNRGMTAGQMAKEIGIPDHVYRRVEKTGQMPSPQNARTIAKYFGETVAEMWQLEAA